MARLEAVAKGLFYPTPMRCIDLIADAIEVQGGGALLDPCAGDGAPAQRLAERWGLTAYGVELQSERAALAASRFTCLRGSYQQIEGGPFSVLFLNPPYDWASSDDEVSARQEIQFLQETCKHLAHEGLLVYVVPRRILQRDGLKNILQRHFRQVTVWQFPSPEIEAFDQVVLVARMFRPQYSDWRYGYYGSVDGLVADEYPVLGTQPYVAVELPSLDVPEFTLIGRTPEDICPSWDLESPSGAYAGARWSALTQKPPLSEEAPLMAPRPGHQAMLLAAGRLNGAEMAGCLVKGGSDKVKITIEHENETIVREKIVSHLCVLSLKTGELETWNVNEEPEKTAAWFTEHRDGIQKVILQSHEPQFDGDLAGFDFSRLRAPGILPGRSEPEILEIQQQTAAAIVHHHRHNKSTVLSGEMGVGKTTVALASCELEKHERVVVVCPSHLVPKWIREAEAVTGIKGIAVTARTLSEVDAFFDDSPPPQPPEDLTPVQRMFRKRARRTSDGLLLTEEANEKNVRGMLKALGDTKRERDRAKPRYLILSKERAKLGARWEPAFQTRTRIVQREIRRGGHHPYGPPPTVEIVREREQGVSCPRCGAMQEIEGLLLSIKNMDQKNKRHCVACQEPLWQSTPINAKGTKRWPLARYINKRYAHRYALIVDECHQHARGESDQARAVVLLSSTATKTLEMTGTLYGGRASSIFYLLYRVSPVFRSLYKFTERAKFVQHHGLFENVYKEQEQTSVYGYRRGRTGGRVREIPGMSPAMVPMLLPFTLFVKLMDLRLELPPYEEIVELVDHEPEILREANNLASEVRSVIRKYPKVLGQYLMACLGYPDRPDQAERIVALDEENEIEEVLATARAFPTSLYPKDQRLVELVRDEHAQGRKVLVFFTQTKRRDARPRIRQALTDAGFRVSVLNSDVPPEKREAWLRNQEREGFDVMLTNGKLVETGMDLMFASTIVQYGTEYSVATLRQSIRRSWRLGQINPIKVIFLAYRGTMQAIALDLIARKMRAAEAVDGDEAGGLAQHDAGGTNFLVELAHEVLESNV